MEVVQLKRFERALKVQQTVAVHDLGKAREVIDVEGAAGKIDRAVRSTEQKFAILVSIADRSYFTTFRQRRAALRMAPSALAPTVKRRLEGIV